MLLIDINYIFTESKLRIDELFELLNGIFVFLLDFSEHPIGDLDFLYLFFNLVWAHVEIVHVVEPTRKQNVVAAVTK